VGRGAGGQHVIDQCEVPTFHIGVRVQREGMTQIALARLGVEILLGAGVVDPP
jgi:hypothetical protein